MVFKSIHLAVFVDGCYWHGCPDHYAPSKTNCEYWDDKIRTNRQRDEDTNRRLAEAGWTVIRVWEHESPEAAARRIAVLVHRIREDGQDRPM